MRLPWIIPVVLYQGEQRWTAALDLAQLFHLTPQMAGAAGELLPRFRYLVDDVRRIDPEELRTRPLTPAARAALVVLATDSGSADATEELLTWAQEFQQLLDQDDGPEVFTAILTYLWTITETPESRLHEFAAGLGTQAEEITVSTAQKLRAEGEARGEANGRAGLLLDLLARRFGPVDAQMRQRITSASPDEIALWSARFADGATDLTAIVTD